MLRPVNQSSFLGQQKGESMERNVVVIIFNKCKFKKKVSFLNVYRDINTELLRAQIPESPIQIWVGYMMKAQMDFFLILHC